MPRQNFLSKVFFVNAPENEIRQALLSLPQFIPNIKWVNEKRVVPSEKFIFEPPAPGLPTCVSVSLLPLNDEQTRVSLCVAYTNGQVFGKDSHVANALLNFEAALCAGLSGNINQYRPSVPQQSIYAKLQGCLQSFWSSIPVVVLGKRFS